MSIKTLFRTGMAVVDHGLIAGVSFLTTVVVARVVEPAEFGIFAVGLTFLILGERIQYGLISSPLLALAPKRSGEDVGGYMSSALALHLAVGLGLAALSLLGAGISTVLGAPPGTLPIFMALSVLLPVHQVRDFSRYVLYVRERLDAVLLMNVVYGAVHAGGLVLLWTQNGLTASNVLWVWCLSSALSASAGFVGSWRVFRRPRRWTDAWANHWALGSWMAGSYFLHWAAVQVFLFVPALVIGAAGAGAFKAVQTVFGPTQFIAAGLFNLTIPNASRVLERDGVEGLGAGLRFFYLSAVLLVGGYCLVILAFPRFVLELFYGDTYVDYALAARLLAPGFLLGALSGAPRLGLLCLSRTDTVFRAHLFVLGTALLVVVPFTSLWGVSGAGLGLTLVFLIRLVASQGYYSAAARGYRASRSGDPGDHRLLPSKDQGSQQGESFRP